jgi:hypothetical protein
LRQIRQSGKIPATWQNSGNVLKFWQCGKINVGSNTLIRQSGKIPAIRQGSGNLATKFLKIIYPGLFSVARRSCD